MKKTVLSIAILAVVLIFSTDTFAQKFKKMDISPMDAAAHPDSWRESNKLVKVIYSRPQLKGRSLDKLAPQDKVWRTGANEAPEITFYSDVLFGDKEVEAGTYTLFTIPSDYRWIVILSNQKNIWGSYFYDQTQDVVRTFARVQKVDKSIEAFSIVFEGEQQSRTIMHLGWANTVVSLPITKMNSSEEKK